MSRHIGGAQAMKCWEEAIEKEELTRLQWYDKMARGDIDSSGRSKQYEVFKRRIELNGPVVTEDFLRKLPKLPPKVHHKRANEYHEQMARLHDDNVDLAEMRDAEPCVKKLLYDGFTKEEKGRYQYLRQRKLEIPERKYQFPLLSSWDYGWRLKDVIKVDDLKKPPFGRTKIVKDTFYRRNGIPTISNPSLAKSYTVMF